MHVLLCASKIEMAGVLFVPAKIISVSSAECMSTLPVCVNDGIGNWQGESVSDL